MDPLEVFRRESTEAAYLQGVASHGYDRHPSDRRGLSRSQFADKARTDLRTSDRAIVADQADGKNLVWGNTQSGMVGWYNSSKPHRSTYFKPSSGVNRYLESRTTDLKALGQNPRSVDPHTIRQQAKQSRNLPAVNRAPAPKRQVGSPPKVTPAPSVKGPTVGKSPPSQSRQGPKR